MKSNLRWVVGVAAGLAAWLNGPMSSLAASAQSDEATAMMSSYDREQRAAAAAREKDASWKPSCSEVSVIQVGDKKGGAVKNFCLNAEGNLLTCYAPNDKKNAGIRVYSPKGELLKTMPLEIKPAAICVT